MLNKTTTTTVKTMVNGVAKRVPLNMSGTEIRTETILITPDMARHWLGSNTRSNRRPSAKTVDAYAREMAAGRWLVTHQGIAFNQAGELVDGQHRLLAIIEADVNILMMVTTGLAVEYNSPIDQGYNRSLAQVLGRQARWISVVRGLYALEQGLGDGGFKATSGMIDEVSGRHSAAIDSVLEIVKTRMLPTGGLAALVYAWPVDPQTVANFARQVDTGEMLEVGDPAYSLRRWLSSGAKRWPKENMLATIGAVRSAIENVKHHSIYARTATKRSGMSNYAWLCGRRRALGLAGTPAFVNNDE